MITGYGYRGRAQERERGKSEDQLAISKSCPPMKTEEGIYIIHPLPLLETLERVRRG